MITLSMIVKNEEKTLGTCLKSVRDFVQEIIIIDTGSIDHTREIAASFGAKLQEFAWVDDFSAARNFALSFVKTPWTLWADADDLILNPELLPTITQQAHKDRADSIWSIYKQDASCYQRRLQLFKTKNYTWKGVVHESPQPKNQHNSLSVLSDLVVLHRKPLERCPIAARQYLDILLTKDKDNWLGLAESYKYLAAFPDDINKQREYVEKADEHYYKAFNWEGTNEPTKYICLFNMARLNLDLSHWDSKFTLMAKRLAQLGVGTDPHRAECWVILGQAEEARGDLTQAAQCYYRATQLTPATDNTGLVYPAYYDEIPNKLLDAVRERIAQKEVLDNKTKVDLWTPT